MEYEQFFTTNTIVDTNPIYLQVAIVGLLSLNLVMKCCLCWCNKRRHVAKLEQENHTLKSIVLQSVDKALVNMLKNGSYDDGGHID
jgi:hypothetical protein